MKSKLINKKTVIIFLLIICILLILLTVYKYYEYSNLIKNSNNLLKIESEKIVKSIDAFYNLPKNETPTVATITNYKELDKTLFYKDAKNGDKIVIYTKNQLAIIYRPSINKIVSVASINNITPTPNNANINITILNASTILGLAEKAKEDLIKGDLKGLKITTGNYTNTPNIIENILIINNPDLEYKVISNIANTLNATIAKNNIEEVPNNSDIVVILAK